MIGSDSCHEIVVFEVQGMYLTVEVNKYDLVLNDSKGTLGSANTLGGECMNLFKYNWKYSGCVFIQELYSLCGYR